MNSIQAGQFYRHFKTKQLYKIIAVGKDSETLELVIVYEAQYDNPESKVWCRSLQNFCEEIERDGVKMKRFTLVE